MNGASSKKRELLDKCKGIINSVQVSTGSHQHQQQGQQEKTVNYALEIAAEENVFTNDDNIITKV